jgi:outer membrane protein
MRLAVPRPLRRLAVVVALLAAPVVLAPVLAHAEVPAVRKLAMVDMQRVLNETKAGKKARGDLESSSKTKQAKVDKVRVRLESDVAKLKDMKGEQLAAAQEKLQRESVEMQNMLMTLEQDLATEHNKLLETMYKNAQVIVAAMAKEQGFDLVLVRDAMTVIYARDSLDITTEVIKKYDAKHKPK